MPNEDFACPDCVMLIANGETPPNLSEEATQAWVEEFERRTDGYHLVVGRYSTDFSTQSCDVCGSRLAGERTQVTFLPIP